MESLERLREFVRKGEHTQLTVMPPINLVTLRVGELTKLIDAVEEEHGEEYAHAYDKGYDEGFARDDDWLGQHEDVIAEHGWVKLPVGGEAPSKQLADWIERRGLVIGPLDANGELWHSGDMSDTWGVIEYITFQDGMWLVSGHDTSAPWVPADSIRHHHEPTVEDVLRDYASRILIAGCIDEEDELVAEYAKKLRLAGDE